MEHKMNWRTIQTTLAHGCEDQHWSNRASTVNLLGKYEENKHVQYQNRNYKNIWADMKKKWQIQLYEQIGKLCKHSQFIFASSFYSCSFVIKIFGMHHRGQDCQTQATLTDTYARPSYYITVAIVHSYQYINKSRYHWINNPINEND